MAAPFTLDVQRLREAVRSLSETRDALVELAGRETQEEQGRLRPPLHVIAGGAGREEN